MSKQHLLEIEACYRKLEKLATYTGLFGTRPVSKSAGESALQARDREIMERREALVAYRGCFQELGRLIDEVQGQ